MSIKPLVNNPDALFNKSLNLTASTVVSQKVVTQEIVPPVGGELCADELCVKCEDGEKLQYQTPDVGTSGQYLGSNGNGTLEFKDVPETDLTELENKTQNIDVSTSAGITNINGATNTDTLSCKALDNSVITLQPNDLGISGQVLKTTGTGQVYWSADEFNPSGIEFAGAPTGNNFKVVRFNSDNGLSAVASENMTDTALGVQFNGTSINNINNVQCNGVSKLGMGDLEIKSNTDHQTNQIKNIVDGSLPNDVVTKGYIDSANETQNGNIALLQDKTQHIEHITGMVDQTIIENVVFGNGTITEVINTGSGTSVPNKNYVDAANNAQNGIINDISDKTVAISRSLAPNTTTILDDYNVITSNEETKLESEGIVVTSILNVPKFRVNATANQCLQTLDMSFNKISTLLAPTLGLDAANKNYVDGKISDESLRIDDLENKTSYTTVGLGSYAVNSDGTLSMSSVNSSSFGSDTVQYFNIGGIPKITIGNVSTTMGQLVDMASNRILNVGTATAPNDAMNKTSVEAITDPLDTRLIAVEDKTVCQSVVGNGANAELVLDCEAKITLDTAHFVVSDPNGAGTNPKFEVNDPAGPVLNTTTISNQLMKINADLGALPPSEGIHLQIADADKIVILDDVVGMFNIDSTNNNVAVQYSNKIASQQKELITATNSTYSNDAIVLNAPSISCNNNKISDVADPISPQDVATKAYVDSNSSPASAGFILENVNNNSGNISGFLTPTVYYPFSVGQSGPIQGIVVRFVSSGTCNFRVGLYNGDSFGAGLLIAESNVEALAGYDGRRKIFFTVPPTLVGGNTYTLAISASNNTSVFPKHTIASNQDYFVRHENANYTITNFPGTLTAGVVSFNERILTTLF